MIYLKYKKLDMQDIKIASLNFAAFTFSFTGIEQWFKLTLLTVSIIYTVLKIIELKSKK
tara:strand:+ start:251 stop:427 length:177 start_codon:yes stop_codon:yes gene_type:complete